MKVAFNIGLNVRGAEPHYQLNRTLRALSFVGDVADLHMQAGEWQGVEERSLQALVNLYHPEPLAAAATLARYLEQDAVAVIVPAHDFWKCVDARGIVTLVSGTGEFPIIVKG